MSFLKPILIAIGIALGLVGATLTIWPGMVLVPEYLLVWVMNGGNP